MDWLLFGRNGGQQGASGDYGEVATEDLGDIEEYIGQIVSPDLLRRMAGTPSIVDVIVTAKGAVARKPWPREVRDAADLYLNRFLPDAESQT